MGERRGPAAWRRPLWGTAGTLSLLALTIYFLPNLTTLNASPFPPGDPSVELFQRVHRTFGLDRTVVVGLEEPSGQMSLEGLDALRRLTRALTRLRGHGVEWVQSLATAQTIDKPEDGSLAPRPLLGHLPRSPAALEALRQTLSGDPLLLGSLVSQDLAAYLVVVRLSKQWSGSSVLERIQEEVSKNAKPLHAYLLGEPAMTSWLFRRLRERGPYVLLAGLLVLLVCLRVGTGSLGEAAVHLLAFALGAVCSVVWAWVLVLPSGFVAFVAALGGGGTSVAWSAYLGCGGTRRALWRTVALVGVLWLCPRVVSILRDVPLAERYLSDALTVSVVIGGLTGASLGAFLHRAPRMTLEAKPSFRGGWPGLVYSLTGILVAVAFMAARNTLRPILAVGSMFAKDSAPGEALTFMAKKFAGYNVIEVEVDADFENPNVFSQLSVLEDVLEGMPQFSSVQGPGRVVCYISDAFADVWRIPTSTQGLADALLMLDSVQGMGSMLTQDRKHALVVARVPTVVPVDMAVESARNALIELRFGPAEVLAARMKALLATAPDARLLEELLHDARQKDCSRAALRAVRGFFQGPEAPFELAPGVVAALTRSALAAASPQDIELPRASLELGAGARRRLAEMLWNRVRQACERARAEFLLQRFAPPNLSATARSRLLGMTIDALQGRRGHARFVARVTGWPVMATQVGREHWETIVLLVFVASVLLAVLLGRGPRIRILVCGLAGTAMALALGIEPPGMGYGAVLLSPALAAAAPTFSSPLRSFFNWFLAGLGLALLACALSGMKLLGDLGTFGCIIVLSGALLDLAAWKFGRMV